MYSYVFFFVIKGCGCKGIHYRIKNGKCQDCHHGGIQHFSHFNKHVLNPIQRDGYSGDGRLAMFKLKEEVLDKCLLRRTKETRAEDMNLPPRIVSIRTIQLHPIEKDFYDALYTQTKSSFSDYVARGTYFVASSRRISCLVVLFVPFLSHVFACLIL